MSNAWILTGQGRTFDFLNPRAQDVFPEQIIVSLSRTTRFRGLGLGFYSVAQHSILVALLMLYNAGLWSPGEKIPTHEFATRLVQIALLHDASETYMADLPQPLKAIIPGYKRIERRVSEVCYSRFGIIVSDEERESLILADQQASLIERDFLFPDNQEIWDFEYVHPGMAFHEFFDGAFVPQTAIQAFGHLFYERFPMVSGHVH